ncbi:hypothetical protein I302_108303 [Kwoniella bestiolae CBS 10118]|uniref:Uncharacterized protein n=1 Tax=Kwoniella bestiolae CBS 10118 TaxID=1296100 RepID=A0A1B9FW28_9TREE|nr:hypothetical protein I302_07329 [Kwoniella bestiolae CBS 10118]OCF22979.1 hypothetical protein I302_07329 [Kwoniella bestiolae CBS 10118]
MPSSSTQESSAPISITSSQKTDNAPAPSKASSRPAQQPSFMSLNSLVHQIEHGSAQAGEYSKYQFPPPGQRNKAGGIPVVEYVPRSERIKSERSESDRSGQPSASSNREGEGVTQFRVEEKKDEQEDVWVL